ncbi:hypothetical protein MRB53_023030 [Persea americana]|uniref:Uncharacterized protein n=1 Tax=Persea americana TaxID=3435 RepID=A0ACC2L8M6_PERAE|nr:hypothetical protein MRB53_023030 [Persea americana]
MAMDLAELIEQSPVTAFFASVEELLWRNCVGQTFFLPGLEGDRRSVVATGKVEKRQQLPTESLRDFGHRRGET